MNDDELKEFLSQSLQLDRFEILYGHKHEPPIFPCPECGDLDCEGSYQLGIPML